MNQSTRLATCSRFASICLLAIATVAHPATYNASNTSQLITAINLANLFPQADTINMTYGTYTLSTGTSDNDEYGGKTGLPKIKSPVTINGNGSTIRRNHSAGDFRVMRIQKEGRVTLNDLVIADGSGPSGAGIYSEGELTLNNCSILRNLSTMPHGYGPIGGGILAFGPLVLNRCQIVENGVQGYWELSQGGGGICAFSSFQMFDTTVRQNFVYGSIDISDGYGVVGGGGVVAVNSSIVAELYGATPGPVIIERCTFEENVVGAPDWWMVVIGGALYLVCDEEGGDAVIRNSTFSKNRAGDSDWAMGGAIVVANEGGSVSIANCTIAGNTSSGGHALGGGLAVFGHYDALFAPLTMGGTILADNLPGNFDYISFPNGFVGGAPPPGEFGAESLGYNLSSDETATSILIEAGDLNSTPAMLGALGNHGGWTNTIPLLFNSPAIDGGDPASALNHDQRNQPRPLDGDGNGTAIVDIGAFEFYLRANSVEVWGYYE